MKTTFLAIAILAIMASCAKKTETSDNMMNDTTPAMVSNSTMQNNEMTDSTKMKNDKMMKQDSVMKDEAMMKDNETIKKDGKMTEK